MLFRSVFLFQSYLVLFESMNMGFFFSFLVEGGKGVITGTGFRLLWTGMGYGLIKFTNSVFFEMREGGIFFFLVIYRGFIISLIFSVLDFLYFIINLDFRSP